jgi:hypothetical protein
MTSFDIRAVNLKALNSLTKYPSIPTYHHLDPRNGGLIDETVPFAGPVIGTEKVDGTNSRIIMLPGGGYLLGSREELLYARGDLIGNPALGIVEHLKPVAERLTPVAEGSPVTVFYLETYGGKIGGQAKNYSTSGTVGWRLFDVSYLDADERLEWPAERISAWRDNAGQAFAAETELAAEASKAGLTRTPRLFTLDAADVPTDIEGMHAFLGKHLPGTLAALDETAKGAAEGIVLRTPDRSVIAKARFQDYERTLKRRASRR